MNSREKLKKRHEEILQQICSAPAWVNGSVVETTKKHKGKETPFFYLSQSINGKNKITYISAKHLSSFKKAAVEGRKIRKLQIDLSAINSKLIKSEDIHD
jgi:hypothetical protein